MQFLKSSTQEEKEITALNKYKLFILLLKFYNKYYFVYFALWNKRKRSIL